jgi:hypothetical protein
MKRFRFLPILFTPILAAIYPFLFYCAHNITEFSANNFWSIFLFSLAGGIILFLAMGLIIRNWEKSALVTSLVAIFFFSYGHLRNSLITTNNFFGRIIFLLPLSFIIFSFFIYVVIKMQRSFHTVILASNMIFFVLTANSAIPLISKIITDYRVSREYQTKAINNSQLKTGSTPDIYLLLMDEYGRKDELQNIAGFDNSNFINSLKTMNFTVLDCSHSNYFWTMQSLDSILNMRYINDISNGIENTSNNLNYQKVESDIHYSRTREELEKRGYNTVSYETSYSFSELRDADYFIREKHKDLTLNPFKAVFINTTLYSVLPPIAAKLGLVSKQSGNGQEVFANSPEYYYTLKIDTFNKLEQVTELQSPKFIFAHLLGVHAPYVYDANGNYTGEQPLTPENYAEQVIYNNNRVLTIVQKIIAQSETSPIIFLISDHGFRKSPEVGFDNFISIYAPDTIKKDLYPTITPVNLFRVLFTEQFGEDYPMLPDYQFFSKEEETGVFEFKQPGCPR